MDIYQSLHLWINIFFKDLSSTPQSLIYSFSKEGDIELLVKSQMLVMELDVGKWYADES